MPVDPVDPVGLVVAAAELGARLGRFDPALSSGDECAEIAEALTRLANQCSAAAARAAARAAACQAHRGRGFVDAADWVARSAGTTLGAARAALDTAAALESSCDATRAALVSGDVSMAQAGEIVRAEAERPGAEAELVALAARSNLSTVKDRARKLRLEAADRDELYARQRAARSGTHWVDGAGMVWAKVGLAPDAGIAFVNRWDAETDRVWRAAQRADAGLTREQAAADAFVALVDGTARVARGQTELVVVVDVGALRRGHVHDGERCHVVGGGPVPVDVACSLLDADPFVKAVAVDGTDIRTVRHFGRHIPAELRTALLLGPDLDGARCAVDGCDRRYGLELDHLRPVAAGGPTSLENLEPKCWAHHVDKSRRERSAGLYDPSAWDPP